jgi:putative hydrolase of the HAD superfamily
MPSALLIDLDDTLVDDRGAMAKSVLMFREKHRLVPNENDDSLVARWDEVGRELWHLLALGKVTFQEQRRIRLRRVFLPNLLDYEADALFEDYLTFYEQSWLVLPGAYEFLAATAHLPRVIVTNGHRPQVMRKLQKCGLTGQFKGVVTPDDCGARKPDAKIFTHALNLLHVHACDALMIGDNFETDIKPALALGMKAFHVCTHEAGRTIRHATDAVQLER